VAATGIKEAFRAIGVDVHFVYVDMSTIRFTLPDHEKRYVFFTPPKVQLCIWQTDQGMQVTPMSFQLDRRKAAQVLTAIRHMGNLPTLQRKPKLKSKSKAVLKIKTAKLASGKQTISKIAVEGGKPPRRGSFLRSSNRRFGMRLLREGIAFSRN
jgi:hypothetical protein